MLRRRAGRRVGRARRGRARRRRARRRHDPRRAGDDGAGRARHPAEPALDAELLPREAALSGDRQLRPARHQRPAHLAAPLWGKSPRRALGDHRARVHRRPAADQPLADEVLTDHPHRVRALWVESDNPANTVADTRAFEQAMRACELSVVVDVAYTETAALADYVLPAASQHEKWECTLFTFEWPTNYFHLRRAALRAARRARSPSRRSTPGCSSDWATCPTPRRSTELTEIARSDRAELMRPRRADDGGEPGLVPIAPVLLYRTLGATLPDGAAAAAPLWVGCHRTAATMPTAVQRALDTDRRGSAARRGALRPDRSPAPAASPSPPRVRRGLAAREARPQSSWPSRSCSTGSAGSTPPPSARPATTRSRWSAASAARTTPTRSCALRRGARPTPTARCGSIPPTSPRSASTTAAGWRSRPGPAASSCGPRSTTRCAAARSRCRTASACPYPDGQGGRVVNGPRINLITDADDRDPIAGTPYHKNVPVRLEPATAAERARRRAPTGTGSCS